MTLKQLMEQRMKTIMIGAIASFEEHFDEYLDKDAILDDIFEDVRKEILDKGNNIIRKLDKDLGGMRTAEVDTYKYDFKVKGKRC